VREASTLFCDVVHFGQRRAHNVFAVSAKQPRVTGA